MTIKNAIIQYFPYAPDILRNKITPIATCELTKREIYLLAKAYEGLERQLLADGVNENSLTHLNLIFTPQGNFEIVNDEPSEWASHCCFAIYYMDKLRSREDDEFIVFAYLEELVHHFYSIEDEREVKKKVLQAINETQYKVTEEKLKSWKLVGA